MKKNKVANFFHHFIDLLIMLAVILFMYTSDSYYDGWIDGSMHIINVGVLFICSSFQLLFIIILHFSSHTASKDYLFKQSLIDNDVNPPHVLEYATYLIFIGFSIDLGIEFDDEGFGSHAVILSLEDL